MIHNVDPQLSQWDVGRSVSVTDSKATHIHFANQGDSKAVIIDIINGEAKIPDYLLQTGKALIAYAVLGGVTLESKAFPVRKRERPENYVYEDDQRNYIYALTEQVEAATAEAKKVAEDLLTAKENGEFKGEKGDPGSVDYYSTEREEVGVSHENLNADYIFGLYDALMAEHPGKVQKKEHTNDDGTFTNYEYVISTGEYSTDAVYTQVYSADPHIKKPKYLVLSGIHGTERKTVLSTYRFIRDVLSGHNIPQAFREGAIISVMPIGTPSAFNAFTRPNDEGVDINRNFMWNWKAGTGTDGTSDFTFGDSAGSEKETQAIAHWMAENTDAELFIDFHNSGALNEKVVVLGVPDDSTADTAKKVALRGVDRIIPFWKDVIGYPDKVVASNHGGIEERDVIYSYCASVEGAGMAFAYAYNVLGIRSIGIETVVYYGDHYEYKENELSYQPEVIAMGAEALGNILLEFYDQSCEVIMMSKVDNKLDMLIEGMHNGFRIESGVLDVRDDNKAEYFHDNKTWVPCSNGAKLLVLQADASTLEIIKATAGVYYTVGILGHCITGIGVYNNRGYCSRMQPLQTNPAKWYPSDSGCYCYNDKGFNFGTSDLHNGKYNWTAYYWND